MLHSLELYTVRDLTKYPLQKYTMFRGFRIRCLNDLIDFIESENLERYFKGFSAAWRAATKRVESSSSALRKAVEQLDISISIDTSKNNRIYLRYI